MVTFNFLLSKTSQNKDNIVLIIVKNNKMNVQETKSKTSQESVYCENGLLEPSGNIYCNTDYDHETAEMELN